jgi:tRNA threonylcarbamoyladenosine biosynthesis protein TsaB
MLICAIDTSGREGSVALAEGDASSFRVLHFAPIAGGTYSTQLIPQISAGLAACGRDKSEINLLVAASGPGSFTGLRVGLSTVKAMSDVLSAPIVAVSVLEAIALAAKRSGVVLSALDAQRNEIFVGEYESVVEATGEVRVRKLEEAVLGGEQYAAWLSARAPVPVTYTPDAAVEKRVRAAGSPTELVARPAADLYARIGLQKYLGGETTPADTLDANYIRRTDAEIFGSPKVPVPPR